MDKRLKYYCEKCDIWYPIKTYDQKKQCPMCEIKKQLEQIRFELQGYDPNDYL